ncbi:hypothetical protein [Mesobacillus thioparans]|uniref:hypothetical protein n=1 Tax=Mesobacillus thioparans TaxID=370439 RepID=UPI0039EFC322
MKNENGYALLLVLVIITITFTFALSMSGMALSARKQVNKTDEINKATDLAEMGVAHYETVLNKIVKNTKWPSGTFDSKLQQSLPQESTISNTIDSNSYRITNVILKKVQDDKVIITFDSIGKTSAASKTLNGRITIEKKTNFKAGDSVPKPEDFYITENNYIDLKGGDKYISYPSATYFVKSIDIHGQRLLEVYGNAFFNSPINFFGTADILIHGDAIFRFKPEFNGNSYSFCVRGNTFYIENNKLKLYKPFPSGTNASCPAPFAEEWFINPDQGVDVQY